MDLPQSLEFTDEEQDLFTRLALAGKFPRWAKKCSRCKRWGPKDWACGGHYMLIDWVRGWYPEVLS